MWLKIVERIIKILNVLHGLKSIPLFKSLPFIYKLKYPLENVVDIRLE